MGQDDFAIKKARFESKFENLTRTQKQVLDLFLQNFGDVAIAAEIGGITESTVRKHIGNSANKLGIPSDKTDKGFRRREIVALFRQFAPERVAAKHDCDETVESLVPKQIDGTQIVTPAIITQEFNLLGRDGDRQKLEEFSQQHKIVLIKAGAGMGKSTLAREFLETHFQKLILLNMGLEPGNVTPADEKVSQILRRDFDEEPSRDFGINLDILREKLSDQTNPIAVLIDNLEPALDENYQFQENLRGYDALLTVLGDRDVRSFTLITSRRSLIVPRAKVHEYSLEGLDITAWRQYFHDYENVETSESLLQMRDAYNGNAKIMSILHSEIKKYCDGNIGTYWSFHKNNLLANKEIKILIDSEINWLRDNQPSAYQLFYQIDLSHSLDQGKISFTGLLQLLDNTPESSKISVIDSLFRTSLIDIQDKESYYLSPVLCEAAKLHLWKNTSVFDEFNAAVDVDELVMNNFSTHSANINSDDFLQDSINKGFTQEDHSIKLSNLTNESIEVSSVFMSALPTSENINLSAINIESQAISGINLQTNDILLDVKQDIINPAITNNQFPSMFLPNHFE